MPANGRRRPQASGTSPIALLVYGVAFLTGAVVMSFEMLGSRYLNPYFGSGIYTWASLISTVLAALCVGYFLGGFTADRYPSLAVLGTTVLIGSAYLLLLPLFAQPLLEALLAGIEDIRTGSLVSAFAILFFPVTFLGMYSPFAIRLLLRSTKGSGTVSGMVYGISTVGSIVGTLGTTFVLIPMIGSRAITISLGLTGLLGGLALIAAYYWGGARRSTISLVAAVLAVALLPLVPAKADLLVDLELRAEMLKKKDGQIAHVETEYNDIYVSKRRNHLTMSFQLKGWNYTESVANLADPDDLPLAYSRAMMASLAFPEKLDRVLMIGLGGGSISTYLGRFMPNLIIDTVEIDQGVIDVAKRYFGIRESERVRYVEGDGRVFLRRQQVKYDLILLDAYHGGYVPFHLLTKEFYELVKERLAPGGAVAFNVHEGTRLYSSTYRTLMAVFGNVWLYPSGQGETIMVSSVTPSIDRETLDRRAAERQEQFKFRFPVPALLARQTHTRPPEGDLLTDDFAPANLYEALRETRGRKK